MFKFNSITNAKSFIANTIKPGKWSIVCGSDFKFWVVTNREASQLEKQGFEVLNSLRS